MQTIKSFDVTSVICLTSQNVVTTHKIVNFLYHCPCAYFKPYKLIWSLHTIFFLFLVPQNLMVTTRKFLPPSHYEER